MKRLPRKRNTATFGDDNPEWTKAGLQARQPAHEVLPLEAPAAFRKSRGPQAAPTKVAVSTRLSRDVIDRLKADGPGWQSRIDEALSKAARLR